MTEHCPSCGSSKVTEALETSTFQYGTIQAVALQVTQPVIHCSECEESFTDSRGEAARDRAVQLYRRALYPQGWNVERRVLCVFGGRDYTNVGALNTALALLHADHKFTHLMNGGADGADKIADGWARLNGVQPVGCDALWAFYKMPDRKNPAGPIRNQRMIELEPEFGLCCPGGRGTADMLERFKHYMRRRPFVRLFVMGKSGHFEEQYA